jgi:hypothetical protein
VAYSALACLPEQPGGLNSKQAGCILGRQQDGRSDRLSVVSPCRADSNHFASSRLGVAKCVWLESYPTNRIRQM